MQVVSFPEQNTVYAKEQPQYHPLPAHHFGDDEGRIACCWSLTWRERFYVLITGKVWQQVLTFRSPLQPQKLSVEKPDMNAALSDGGAGETL